MRSDSRFDDTAPSFTLVCPGFGGGKSHGRQDGRDRHDGKLTFMIGEQVAAEIAQDDLVESWAAAAELTPTEMAKMAEVAAGHLTDLIESGLPPAELTEAVTDAAVVLLLAMKRNGITDPKRIPPCTVMWNGHEMTERVVFGG